MKTYYDSVYDVMFKRYSYVTRGDGGVYKWLDTVGAIGNKFPTLAGNNKSVILFDDYFSSKGCSKAIISRSILNDIYKQKVNVIGPTAYTSESTPSAEVLGKVLQSLSSKLSDYEYASVQEMGVEQLQKTYGTLFVEHMDSVIECTYNYPVYLEPLSVQTDMYIHVNGSASAGKATLQTFRTELLAKVAACYPAPPKFDKLNIAWVSSSNIAKLFLSPKEYTEMCEVIKNKNLNTSDRMLNLHFMYPFMPLATLPFLLFIYDAIRPNCGFTATEATDFINDTYNTPPLIKALINSAKLTLNQVPGSDHAIGDCTFSGIKAIVNNSYQAFLLRMLSPSYLNTLNVFTSSPGEHSLSKLTNFIKIVKCNPLLWGYSSKFYNEIVVKVDTLAEFVFIHPYDLFLEYTTIEERKALLLSIAKKGSTIMYYEGVSTIIGNNSPNNSNF